MVRSRALKVSSCYIELSHCALLSLRQLNLNSQFQVSTSNRFYITEFLRPWQHSALSHWCIFHRKKAREIVETWAKKFHDAPRDQRVPFLYLANDILQNSRRKGPEFVNEFWTLLPKALREVVDSGPESVKNASYRLVWVPHCMKLACR